MRPRQDEHKLSDANWDEVAKLSLALLLKIEIHSLTPGVMGRGKTKLEDKLSTGLFMRYLDTGSHLRATCRNSCAWITDGGVEFGFNDYQSKEGKLHPILPLLRPDPDIDTCADRARGDGSSGSDLDVGAECRVVGPRELQQHTSDDELEPDHGGLGVSAHEPCPPPPVPPEDWAQDMPVPEGDYVFPRSIRILGPMHILDNALDDCWAVLDMFAEYKPMLTALLRMLGRVAPRERFIQRCIDPFPERHRYKPLFEFNAPQLYEKRWGSLDKCARYVHRVAKAFLICWDAAQYIEDGNQDDKINEEHQVNVKLIDKAARLPRFWVFHIVVISIGKLPASLAKWLEDCPCHRGLLSKRDVGSIGKLKGHFKRLLRQNKKGAPGFLCKMRAKCAPEVAMKQHRTFLQAARRQCRTQLMQEIAEGQQSKPGMIGVSPGDVAKCLADFDKGADHLEGTLELKLKFVDEPPFTWAALAYHDVAAAKQHGLNIMRKFDTNPVKDAWDRLTFMFCSDTGPFRAALLEWFQSSDRWPRMEYLRLYIASFRFIPMSERPEEGEHFRLKRALAWSRGRGLQASLSRRMPEMITKCIVEPTFKGELLEHMKKVSTPKDAIQELGLSEHPYVLQRAGENLGKNKMVKVVKDMVTERQPATGSWEQCVHTQFHATVDSTSYRR